MKVGKLESLCSFIKTRCIDADIMYVETDTQRLLCVRTITKLDKYDKQFICKFPDIEIFEYEIGYCEEWDKVYMNIQKEIESEADFFGTLFFEKNELKFEKDQVEMLRLEYISEGFIEEEYMSYKKN